MKNDFYTNRLNASRVPLGFRSDFSGLLFGGFLWLGFSSCQGQQSGTESISSAVETKTASFQLNTGLPDQEAFSDYWYQGLAELNVFDLEQVRYGELRRGDAVMIFVTEDISRKERVKLDHPEDAGDKGVHVMKLNFTREFPTGIYAYRTMQSVFTPVHRGNEGPTLKVSTSSQEWCGHVYMDLQWEGGQYKADVSSYFEGESVEQAALGEAWAEDEVWNLIRLNPEELPLGNFRAIPSNLDIRLRHIALESYDAAGSVEAGEPGMKIYTLRYPGMGRELRIYFEENFPFRITEWSEKMANADESLVTRAVLRKQLMSDYWRLNRESDAPKRLELGLD